MRGSTKVFVSQWEVGVPGSYKVDGPIDCKDAVRVIGLFLAGRPLRGSRMEFRVSTKREAVEYVASTNGASEMAQESLISELDSIFAEQPNE